MKIDKVTITGADNSVSPMDLLVISSVKPFVEWGILFSQSRSGTPRFPGPRWIQALWEARLNHDRDGISNFSAHLCGGWVRDIIMGKPTFIQEEPELFAMFDRVQINMHGHKMIPSGAFREILRVNTVQWILQLDGVNDALLQQFPDGPDANVVGLFDVSGGAGIVPKEWPKPTREYSGYAGGLGPENLADNLKRIEDAVGDARIWIDCETRIRSGDDRVFDLDKVRRFLDIAAPYVSV